MLKQPHSCFLHIQLSQHAAAHTHPSASHHIPNIELFAP